MKTPGQFSTAINIAWGMWRFADASEFSPEERVDAALGSGFTLFDTADVYGFSQAYGAAESVLGDIMRARPQLRDELCLATKGGIWPGVPYNSSRRYLEQAVEGSLKRLGVERIDLYFIHRRDLLTHPAALAETLEGIVTSGKIAAVGVSNYGQAEVAALRSFLNIPVSATQPELSLNQPSALENGIVDDAMASRMAILAWSPLGGGALARSSKSNDLADAIAASAERHHTDPALIALSWLLRHPAGIIPIIGSQSPDRIRQAALARNIEMPAEEWYGLLQAARGEQLP